MVKRFVISASQMFSMLFISRLVVEITYSGIMAPGENIWDHMVSALVSFIINFLLIIPVYFLFKLDESMDILDNSYSVLGKFGNLISAVYAIYFLFICVHTLSLFKVFLSHVVNPPISTEILLSTMVVTACYAAYKGVEGLARTSGIILAFIILSIVFIGFSLVGNMEKLNFSPLLYEGYDSVLGGIMFMVSRSSFLPAMALLFPMAKGNIKRGIVVWNICIYSVIALAIFIMVGSMGDFIKTQLFPAYTAASIAKIGSLENLDAFYIGIWTMGIFVKLALFLMLAGECTKKIFGENIGRGFTIIYGIIMVFFGVLINKNSISAGIFSSNFLLLSVIFTGVVIPIIFIILKKIKNNGGRRQNEK